MLSWFPTAACKVKRLKEGAGGGQGGRGLGHCKWLVKFNRVSGDSSPLLTHPSTESSWTHEELTWIGCKVK